MATISEGQIIAAWKKRLSRIKNKQHMLFNLYIDNPFCINQCKYCIHQGEHVKQAAEDYNRYYQEYLPRQIDKFRHLLEQKTPDTIYFGGGSPNSMSASMMENIFNLIPDFKIAPNKVFESNPALMNKRKLQLLSQNKFSYVSLGIQSLHPQILAYNKRQGYNHSNLSITINRLQDAGAHVNCDLMAFIGPQEDERDLQRLEEDFELLYKKFSPDIITIYPNKNILKYFWEEKRKKGKQLIVTLRKKLAKLRDKFQLNSKGLIDKHKVTNLAGYRINYILYDMSEKELIKTKIYNSTDPRTKNQPSRQNVMGLGGYKKHKPFSYHGRNFSYITANKNWTPVYKTC